MKNTDERSKNSEEIDLGQFFRWIGRGFNRVGDGFIYFLASLRNLFFSNIVFFAIVIGVGLALGGFYSQLIRKTHYKSTMVLSCDYLNTEIIKNIIEKLNQLAGDGSGEGLAGELKIDAETAKNTARFDFKPFVSEDDIVEMEVLRTQLSNLLTPEKQEMIDKVVNQLIVENKDAYSISVSVYNPEVVTVLESAIVNYFRNNPYIQRRIEVNKVNLNARKAKLLQESRRLDSLKSVLVANYQVIPNKSRGSNNVVLAEDKLPNAIEIYKEDLLLNNEILRINSTLFLQSDFEVVDGFTMFKKPETASLPRILFNSFWISLLVGFLILAGWRFDKMLANYPIKK